MPTRALITSLLSSCLLSLAAAGDLVVVAGGSSVHAYHFDSGNPLSGGPWIMPDNVADMERSLGGGTVYVTDQGGHTSRIRMGPMVSNMAPQPHNLGALDMAYDPIGRRLISVEGTSVMRYLEDVALNPMGYTQYQGQSGWPGQALDRVVLTPDGSRGFACDGYALYEVELTTNTTGLLDHITNYYPYIRAMAISPDSKYLALILPGTQICIYDLELDKEIIAEDLAPNQWHGYFALAWNRHDSSLLYIGGSMGIDRVWLDHDASGSARLETLGRLSDTPVLDLAWNDDTELFALHGTAADPNARQVARYTAGLIHSGSIPVPGAEQLVVVPEPEPGKYLVSLLRPEWLGLLEAAEWTGWRLPEGWALGSDDIPGGSDDPKQVKQAAKRAFYWLSTMADSPQDLDPTQVREFLSKAKGSSPASAGLFLDLILLGEEQADE